jgi:hypothetical protein
VRILILPRSFNGLKSHSQYNLLGEIVPSQKNMVLVAKLFRVLLRGCWQGNCWVY